MFFIMLENIGYGILKVLKFNICWITWTNLSKC
jgi:hypothetical protein